MTNPLLFISSTEIQNPQMGKLCFSTDSSILLTERQIEEPLLLLFSLQKLIHKIHGAIQSLGKERVKHF